MHKEGAGLCSYLTILFLLGAIGVRLYTVRTATLGVMEWVYYALVIGGVAITAFDCFMQMLFRAVTHFILTFLPPLLLLAFLLSLQGSA